MPPIEAMQFANSREGIREAREYLSAAQRLDNIIALRLSRLEMLRDRAKKITQAIDYAPRRKAAGDTLANAASEAMDIEEELMFDYARLLARQNEINQLISEIPDDYQKMVLDLRYLQGVSMVGIARRLNYDERTVQRIHEKALRQVALRLAMWDKEPEKRGSRTSIKYSND